MDEEQTCAECMEPMVGDEPEGATHCSLCSEEMELETAIHEEESLESLKYSEDEEPWPPRGICGDCGWPEHEGECDDGVHSQKMTRSVPTAIIRGSGT